jgi:hypothetical protein
MSEVIAFMAQHKWLLVGLSPFVIAIIVAKIRS